MKLYTEEQVTKLTSAAFVAGQNHNTFIFGEAFKDITPIELPTDEDRINKFNAFISTEVALELLTKEQGKRLKWYYETFLAKEIQGGNQ